MCVFGGKWYDLLYCTGAQTRPVTLPSAPKFPMSTRVVFAAKFSCKIRTFMLVPCSAGVDRLYCTIKATTSNMFFLNILFCHRIIITSKFILMCYKALYQSEIYSKHWRSTNPFSIVEVGRPKAETWEFPLELKTPWQFYKVINLLQI